MSILETLAQNYCEAKLRAERTTIYKDKASERKALYQRKRDAWRAWREAQKAVELAKQKGGE